MNCPVWASLFLHFSPVGYFTSQQVNKEMKKIIMNFPNPGFTSTSLYNSPFLRQGNLKSFTRPKSSPVTKTSFWKLASQALTSLVSVYFSQIPFTSTPRTPVQVAQWIALTSSLFAVRFPPNKLNTTKDNPYNFHQQKTPCFMVKCQSVSSINP